MVHVSGRQWYGRGGQLTVAASQFVCLNRPADDHVLAVVGQTAARAVAGHFVRSFAVKLESAGSPSRSSMRVPI